MIAFEVIGGSLQASFKGPYKQGNEGDIM